MGLHAGYASQPEDDDERILFDKNLDGGFGDTVTTTAGANAFSPGFCGGTARGNAPAGGCGDDEDAVEFGVRAGYDRQFGSFVLGGLVEFGDGPVSDSVGAFSTTPAGYTMERELAWLAAARVRAGYGVGRYLGYVTGGVAHADVQHRFSTTNGANTFVQRGDDDVSGHQVGFGVEAQLAPKVSFGLEYLFTRLKDEDYRVRAQGPFAATNPFILTNPNGTDFRRSDEDFEFSSVRATVSYRF